MLGHLQGEALRRSTRLPLRDRLPRPFDRIPPAEVPRGHTHLVNILPHDNCNRPVGVHDPGVGDEGVGDVAADELAGRRVMRRG